MGTHCGDIEEANYINEKWKAIGEARPVVDVRDLPVPAEKASTPEPKANVATQDASSSTQQTTASQSSSAAPAAGDAPTPAEAHPAVPPSKATQKENRRSQSCPAPAAARVKLDTASAKKKRRTYSPFGDKTAQPPAPIDGAGLSTENLARLEEWRKYFNTLSEGNKALSQADADATYNKLHEKYALEQAGLDEQTAAKAEALQGAAPGPVVAPESELNKPDDRHSEYGKKV